MTKSNNTSYSRSQRKPLEFFKFFWRDFNRDTAHLDRGQRDGYMQIICAYYDNHGPLHEKAAMRISGATSEEWLIERDILASFFVVRDGMWRHGRIEKELKEVRKTAEYGRKGGLIRAANAKKKKDDFKGGFKGGLSYPSTTEDGSNEQGAPAVTISKKRLTKSETELLAAKEEVWRLEGEFKRAAALHAPAAVYQKEPVV